MHVPLAVVRIQRVQQLLHAQHVQCRHAQNLRFSALEQCRTVGPRQDVYLGAQRTNVGESSSVDANLVAKHTVAHRCLGDGSKCRGEFLFPAFEVRGQFGDHGGLDVVQTRFPRSLLHDDQRVTHVGDGEALHGLVSVVFELQEDRVVRDGLRRRIGQLLLRVTQCANEGLRSFQSGADDLLRGSLRAPGNEVDRLVGGFGLDHHDGDVVPGYPTGHDHVEHCGFELLVRREADPLTVDQGDAHTADGPAERQPRQLRGRGRPIDSDDVVEVIGVERHDRDDNLNLVTQALLEGRSERTVDQSAGENRVLGGAAFSPEERSGDATHGIHALLDVHRQREEVELVFRILRCRRGAQQQSAAVEGDGD